MTDHDDLNPVAYLADAMRELPADPAQATEYHLQLLADIAQGLARQIERLRADHVALARVVLAGAADDDDAHERAHSEHARLTVLGWGADDAHDRLRTYTRAALAARGISADDLLGGGTTEEEP